MKQIYAAFFDCLIKYIKTASVITKPIISAYFNGKLKPIFSLKINDIVIKT